MRTMLAPCAWLRRRTRWGVYSNAPDVVGGSSLNSVGSGVVGAALLEEEEEGILFGVHSPNAAVTADFGHGERRQRERRRPNCDAVGGGSGNAASGNYATVGGGLSGMQCQWQLQWIWDGELRVIAATQPMAIGRRLAAAAATSPAAQTLLPGGNGNQAIADRRYGGRRIR